MNKTIKEIMSEELLRYVEKCSLTRNIDKGQPTRINNGIINIHNKYNEDI